MDVQRRLMVILAVLFLVSLSALAGVSCGRSETAEVTAEESLEERAGEGTEGVEGTTTGEGPEAAEEGGERPEERPPREAGGLPFSFDTQTIGSGGYPDLTISDIRWSDQGDYYRFVFEIRKTDGGNADRLPLSQSYYSPDRTRLFIFVSNVSVTDDQLREEGDSVFLGHLPVSRITHTTGPSSIEITFVLDLVRPLPCYLHYETAPLRVILDVRKT